MRLALLLYACSSTGGAPERSLDGFLGGDLRPAHDLAVGGLDPLLSPADGSGAPCMTPGSLTECPGYSVCRFYSPTELRCDAADMSNPGVGVPCNQSSDCDLQYSCYRGFCFPFCTLGGTDCGFPDDCVDVGYTGGGDTGVCRT
jgi:hypothetical protein